MKTLIEGYSPDYSYKASKLTGRPNRVTVEVEDTIDAAFWGDLLQSVCPDKEYHFKPFHTVISHNEEKTSKGKSGIMKMSTQLNAYHIGCIDADYDWLLSDSSVYGSEILNNPYLLHTYAYSIENLLCEPKTFLHLCKAATQEHPNTDFESCLFNISTILYPLLIWSLYLISKGEDELSSTKWKRILTSDFSKVQDPLDEIRNRVSCRLVEIEKKYEDYAAEKEDFERRLNQQKGLSPDNAYLYIYGHAFFDHVLRYLLKPVADKLQQKHIERLRAEANVDELGLKISQYVSSCLRLNQELYQNYMYKDYCPLYSMIATDVIKIWSVHPQL